MKYLIKLCIALCSIHYSFTHAKEPTSNEAGVLWGDTGKQVGQLIK